jgi:hypothetical protein
MPASRKVLLTGRVISLARLPLDKVAISWQGKRLGATGADGTFKVPVPPGKGRFGLLFAREGHVSNLRVIDAKARNRPLVVLAPVAHRVAFSPDDGLDIRLNGSRVKIPPNAFSSKPSRAVMDFTVLDPTDPQQRQAIPGAFLGRSKGKLVMVKAGAFYALSIVDAKGQALALREKATIGLEVAAKGPARGGPSSLGRWNLDPSGIVLEPLPGAFFLIPEIPDTLTYAGTMADSSTGETGVVLGNPMETVCVTLRVVDASGNGLPSFAVMAGGNQYLSFGTTDAGGFVCLMVERNTTFWADTTGGPNSWRTPSAEFEFASPDFSSDSSACGDPEKCPFVGLIRVSTFYATDPDWTG